MNYFIKTPSNEWDVKKAFNEYSQLYNANEIKDEMKKDITSLKNSKNIGINLKRKLENFIVNLDKKKTELRADDSGRAQNIFNQQNSSGVINNHMGNVSISNKRGSDESISVKTKKKQKSSAATNVSSTNQNEIEALFNPSPSSANDKLQLPDVPTQIEGLEVSDFNIELKNPYVLNQVNIGSIFRKYQRDIAQLNASGGLLVESNPHELLAVNNILLLKSGQHSNMLTKHFSEETIKDMQKDVAAKFAIEDKGFDQEKKVNIERNLKKLKKTEINSKQAAKLIGKLESDATTFEPADAVIVGLQNLVRKIPITKFNGAVRENVVSNVYADAILSPMFSIPDQKKHLFWLNTKVVDESAKQPDLACKHLKNSNWISATIVGEVKGEDVKDDKHICIKDLIRIGFISVTAINQNLYDGVIGIQIVGLQVTFFITTLIADGFYVMMEICSLTLPRDATELMPYSTSFDDLLVALEYADKCVVTKEKEKLKEMACSGITTPEFARFLSVSKDRTRECPIVYHH
ncbi:hypothetical protein BD408DRAFT_372876 [Parasitella parasitica]|nr:hypothetical protein BD408DRAFT_372876 [Parasitella parasitica]